MLRSLHCPRASWFSLYFVDGSLQGPEVDRGRRGQVKGLGFAVEASALGGHAEAASAGGDDLSDEFLTVHTDLHSRPVLRQLLGQLQVVLGLAALFAGVLRQFVNAATQTVPVMC